MINEDTSVDACASLFETDDTVALRRLKWHAAVIAVLMLWVAIGLPLWGLALMGLAVALAALSTLQHECVHRTPFASGWINDLVGHVTGVLLIQPFRWYTLDHLEQHRRRSLRNTLDDRPETERELLIYLSSIHVWREKADVLLENAGGIEESDFIQQSMFQTLRREAQLMLLFYIYVVAFTVFVWPVLFWIWLLPMALGVPVLRLFELAVSRDMFDNTQDTMMHRAIKFFTWNTSFTKEHYAMPDVPFHKLPHLHALAHPPRRRETARREASA